MNEITVQDASAELDVPILRPYPAYKPTGLNWLDKIPEHWRIRRAKSALSTIDIRSTTGDEELLSVSEHSGVTRRSEKSVSMFMAESYEGHKLCWPGDLVINSLWAWKNGLGVSDYHGIVSSAYGVYRAKSPDSIDPRYLHHSVRSRVYDWELRVRSKGIWISRMQLTDEAFLNMPLLLPPLNEQLAIADFLDAMDERITRFIDARRQMIILLEKQKQAIITHAVTRGLDPDVPMKPSGIDWLGSIPRHWKVSRLKFETSDIVDCLHATPEYVQDGAYPAVRTADIVPGHFLLDQARTVSEETYRIWTERLRPVAGDILYSREGERYGIAAPVPAGVHLCVSQRMMVFRAASQTDSDFLMWQLNSDHVLWQASADIAGATAPHVNIETIKNYTIFMPPLEEQMGISSYIRESMASIERSGRHLTREIELAHEYRTRLIADAVVGKVDIRKAHEGLDV